MALPSKPIKHNTYEQTHPAHRVPCVVLRGPTHRENSHANHTWDHSSHQTACFKGSEMPSVWVRFPSPAAFFVVWRDPALSLDAPDSSGPQSLIDSVDRSRSGRSRNEALSKHQWHSSVQSRPSVPPRAVNARHSKHPARWRVGRRQSLDLHPQGQCIVEPRHPQGKQENNDASNSSR
jgi:hypothetical protein